MRFRGFSNNQYFLVEATQLGGYTSIFISPNSAAEVEKINFQLFMLNAPSEPHPSSVEFLERAARVALFSLENDPSSGDQVRVYGYDLATKVFTGHLDIISTE